MGKLDGKVALITGGNSGIGLASAGLFVAEGAYVFITGRRQAELDEAVSTIGKNVQAVQGDVANSADVDRIFDTIKATKSRLDVVFANAGVGSLQRFGSITQDQFDYVFNVNVRGTLFTVQKMLPLMSAGGAIILTGSTTGSMGTPAFSVYSASKAAIRNYARSWALDLKGSGIRVNVLSPGPTATPGLIRAMERSGAKDAAIAELEKLTPLGRLGKPEETARAALFLASNESSFMTGSEVFVDGGYAQV